jgi:hypothetical protein
MHLSARGTKAERGVSTGPLEVAAKHFHRLVPQSGGDDLDGFVSVCEPVLGDGDAKIAVVVDEGSSSMSFEEVFKPPDTDANLFGKLRKLYT